MFQLSKLRKEREFNKEIGGIVNVLQGVASAEFYRLQKARQELDEFGDYLRDFLQMLDIAQLRHPFLETSSLPQGVLLVTSDAGFLGRLNVAIVDSALNQSFERDELIVVGRQGARYVEETRKNFTSFAGISDEVDYKEAERLAEFILKGFLEKKFGRTIVVYPHFLSFAVWEPRVYQLLPCRFLFREERKAPKPTGLAALEPEEKIILEPSINKIVDYLVRIWITYMLYGIFWESKLSEWSARVMHLEGSSFKIKQTDKKLHFEYFSLFHEISDKNIREIFASRLAVQRARRVAGRLGL
ncbi:MAG: F0F1 ATP synthase subunit gamma [Candidatus Omnitrophota bacterium]|nr:MAG: F0F1 ATP synthase subunit gamma [Candidatus Omnitrophota bacterium]